jgi:hypothetical protein
LKASKRFFFSKKKRLPFFNTRPTRFGLSFSLAQGTVSS